VSNEYYEGQFANNKREGNAKYINRKGEVFFCEFKNNKKKSKIERKDIMKKEEYEKIIKNFMKSKSNIQPMVRILA
jgi:hypothetical protein